jgi:hypothetical protein
LAGAGGEGRREMIVNEQKSFGDVENSLKIGL